ncbi:MAG: DUF2515 family protein [Rhodospirillaceae bacterium]|nr:DUF2515 family protein [Rhodospirillaceae bacterium]
MNEAEIVAEILDLTEAENQDNISRTLAYQNYHLCNPELGWPLLASLVSRNAGYLMTDLHCDPVAAILPEPIRASFFAALEACNSAIFLDAYPQLLLYEKAKRIGRPLLHLLEQVCSSRSIAPYWREFHAGGPVCRLDLALIVNEQCHIERRVFADPARGGCFSSALFAAAMRGGAFRLVFPGIGRDEPTLREVAVRRFVPLDARIAMGRRLYGMLFSNAAGDAISAWVRQRPDHTGSRADYAPELFRGVGRSSPALRSCWPPVRLLTPERMPWNWPSGIERWIAPPRREAWPDRRRRHARFVRRMAALGALCRKLRVRRRRRPAQATALR